MELRHVRVFLVLAEELHFGRAAARLRVAQSAVSQTLRALEDEVGAKLFERTQRRVALTDAGRAFAAATAPALTAISDGAEAARRAERGEVGRLRLGLTTMSALTRVPRVVARFEAAHPLVDVRVEAGTTASLVEAVLRGTCDVAFVSLRGGDTAGLARLVVDRTSLVVLVPEAHPLAREASVDLARIAAERLILLSLAGEPSVRGLLKARFDALGVEPNVALEVQQLEVMLAFVAAGYGVALAPRLVEELSHRGVCAVPIHPSPPSGITAIWREREAPSVARSFLRELAREEPAAADRRPSSAERRRRPRLT